MNVPAIRDALKATAQTIAGLRAYDTEPERIESPAVIFVPADPFIGYHEALAGGLAELHFHAVILVSTAKGWDRAQTAVDTLVSSGTGLTGSLVDVLEAANLDAFGTPAVYVADHLEVDSAESFGTYIPGGKAQSGGTYAAGRLSLTVRAKRT